MPELKLTMCKDTLSARQKAHKLAKANKGVYLVISKANGKVYLAKLPSDTSYVSVTDHRQNKAKLGKAE